MRPLHPSASAAALLAVSACAGQPAGTDGFDAPSPGTRIAAATDAARRGDVEIGTLMHLVEQLDSTDAAVRLTSIAALQRLTGTTLGYRPDAPRKDREAAVERWVAEIRLRSGGGAAADRPSVTEDGGYG